jgi:hypothetical protein
VSPIVPTLIRFRSTVFAIAVASLAVAAPVSSAVTFVSQDRRVTTFATIDFVQGQDQFSNDLFESSEEGVFDEAANCHVGAPGDQATSTGVQLSYLENDLILAEGSMSGQAEISEAATFAEGFGMSRFVPVFSVDVPTEVRVQAELFADGNGATNFVLRVLNGTIFIHRSLQDGTESIDQTLLLQPGAYELTVVSSGYGQALPNGGGSPALGSYSVSLAFGSSTAAPMLGDLARAGAPVLAPNPVRGVTRIFPPAASASSGPITIVDLAGREVRRFANVGASGVPWDARDARGNPVAAGVYLVRAAGGATARAVVLR